MYLKVKKSKSLKGEIRMPRSKTHSFRALVLASLAQGISIIRAPKISNDWHRAVKAMRMYGAKIKKIQKNVFQVEGVAGKLKTPPDVINVGNSGTMMAFTAGVAASCPGWTVLTGDESLRRLRQVSKNFIKPFRKLGITVIDTKEDGMAPFVFKGRVNGGKVSMDGTSCQPVFSLLIASALSFKPVDIYVENPGETAYIDLLLYWFEKVGLKFDNVGKNYTHYRFPGNKPPKAIEVEIPFEWSAVAYPLLAAILTEESEIKVKSMDLSDCYGDKQVTYILQKMGADLTIKENLLTAKSSKLHGIKVDMNLLPDQLPTIAVAACFAKGKTIIKNVQSARWKECDRISAVCRELKKMGAKAEEKKDGLIINQDGSWKLKGTKLNGYKDHRMILSLAVAGLAIEGETIISDVEMVEKSFETFIPEMKKAGANFKVTPCLSCNLGKI